MIEQIESMDALKQAVTKLIDDLGVVRHEVLRPGATGKAAFYTAQGGTIDCDPAEGFLSAISQWDLAEDAMNGEVRRYPGVIELDSLAIKAIRQLNDSKLHLRVIASQVPAATAKDRQRTVRRVLTSAGVGGAHPLQCWREIPVFDDKELRTIGFSVISTSISTEILTKAELMHRLAQREAEDVIEQANQFTFSAARWVLPVSPFIRANVSRSEDGETRTQSIHASLPIVIGKGGWPRKVKFNQPSGTKNERLKETPAPIATIPLPFRDHAYLALI